MTSASPSSFDDENGAADPFASEYEQTTTVVNGSDGFDHSTASPGSAGEKEIEGNVEALEPADDSHHDKILKLLRYAVPLEDPATTQNLMREAKNSRELRRVLETVVYRSALAWDVLNGHGYRVAMITTLTAVAPRCNAAAEWIECVSHFRPLGFQCDRTVIAEGLNLIRAAALHKFQSDGRHPAIISDGLNRLRLMLAWACEDNIQLDHVFFSRLIAVATTLVSLFDRQNVFRANFPEDFNRRDGIVFEWVLGNVRSTDYDQAVFLCNNFVDEVIECLRERIPTSRYSFGLFYRIMDYYFAVDNPEKMLKTMEDSPFPPAESSTAKLMQLACAFNLPNVPELFLKFRALPPQCVIASPDMSRLLFYFARAGGGQPCPECGEKYNHRHPGLHVWEQTPDEQKRCHLFELGRLQKSVLEDRGVPMLSGAAKDQPLAALTAEKRKKIPPQCLDHSVSAQALWQMSTERSIPWNTLEWRGYLLCHMFSSRDAALAALKLVDEQLQEPRFDEFLRQTYVRVLRTHHPEGLQEHIHRFLEAKPIQKVSPIVLQEALMTASAMMNYAPQRFDCLKRVWKLVLDRDSYVVPYTARFIRRQVERRELMALHASSAAGSSSTSPTAAAGYYMSPEERSLVDSILNFKPRSVNLLDLKDGVSDFVVGSTKKNVFIQSAGERSKRDLRDTDRNAYKAQRAQRQQ